MTRELILFWETSAQLRLPRCLASRHVVSRSSKIAILSRVSHPLIQDRLRNTRRQEGVILENITRYGARNFAFCCTVLLGLQPTTPTQKNILRRPSHCHVLKSVDFVRICYTHFSTRLSTASDLLGGVGRSKLKCFGFTGWVGGRN